MNISASEECQEALLCIWFPLKFRAPSCFHVLLYFLTLLFDFTLTTGVNEYRVWTFSDTCYGLDVMLSFSPILLHRVMHRSIQSGCVEEIELR